MIDESAPLPAISNIGSALYWVFGFLLLVVLIVIAVGLTDSALGTKTRVAEKVPTTSRPVDPNSEVAIGLSPDVANGST